MRAELVEVPFCGPELREVPRIGIRIWSVAEDLEDAVQYPDERSEADWAKLNPGRMKRQSSNGLSGSFYGLLPHPA